MENCPVCNEIFDGRNCKNCGFEDRCTETISRLIDMYGPDAEIVQSAKKMFSITRPNSIHVHRGTWFKTFREFEFSVGTLELEKYIGPSSTVVVPYGVDRIQSINGAFSNNLTIKKVILPDTVTLIGFRSFMGCKNLETIEMPDGVTKIGYAAFQNCNSLDLSIPRNVSEIEEGAITCVKHINVHAGNPYFRVHQGMLIDQQRGVLLATAFETANMDIAVPEYVKRIGSSAFRIANYSPKSITLPKCLESIGSWALSSFTEEPIVIPKSVKEIENYALASSNVILEEDNPNYILKNDMIIELHTRKLITMCNKNATHASIPSEVKIIAAGAFLHCKNLMEVSIPRSVEEIGDFAFYGCRALENVVIPYYVTQMGEKVFGKCNRLKTIFCERKSASNDWNSAWSEECDAYIDDGSDIVENSPNQMNIPMVDAMEGHDFEYFCAKLLAANGFENVYVTQGSGDQGIDIIAHKEGIKYGIQCKCHSSDIGNKAVQEVYAGQDFYGCHIGVVLTNQHFTKSAIELAKKNRVILWDRTKLKQMLEVYKSQQNK